MDQCSICLESLDDGGVVALACNHRFHAACLAEMAGAVGTATTRRGALTACQWRWFGSRRDAAKAFGVHTTDVSHLVKNPSKASLRETFEARPAPPKKRKRPTKGKAPRKKIKRAEGGYQKANGKWSDPRMFPGREFDDLDAYRAAKKQRAARRDEYRAQRYFWGHRD